MYSKELQSIFKKKGIEVGDEIRIHSKKGEYSGLLMPRAQGAPDIIVIKMSNGYNIGIDVSDSQDAKNKDGTKIELVKKSGKKPPAHIMEAGEQVRGEIAILGCGGTIASKVEYKTGAVYPAITPAELRAAFPSLEHIAKIHSKQLFSLFSEDMNQAHWKILADAVAEELKVGAKGVVVMHGTDTMNYTAAALSFMLQNLPAPVIFVGSQRSSDRPSSENEMNMLNAVYASKQDLGEVAVCMHATSSDDYCHLHRGTRVRKMHSSRRDAFKSVNSLPLAAVDYATGRFDILTPHKKRSVAGVKGLKVETKLNDNVGLIYVHPGIKPKFIEKLDMYDGVVLIGTGLGHAPANSFNDKTVLSVLPQIKGLIDSGIPVVMSSQTIYGRLNMKVYTTGRMLLEAGVIGDNADWTPEAAFAKLCWTLGQTKDMKKVKDILLQDIAGEISERSLLEQ
jgi:glutamyl-tRNA(Gln) amidotransferase subunit D